MIYTNKIQDAIKFSIKTHEIYQKQKRKGKDIPYITHPLTVGLILSRAGASEDVIVAGILHDTVEDSVAEKKVTREMLADRFGDGIASLVDSVTDKNKETLSWDDRKRSTLGHIPDFSHESLLVKSADVMSNVSELLDDYRKDGDDVFKRFNAPREKILKNYAELIDAIVKCWHESPLAEDLELAARELLLIENTKDDFDKLMDSVIKDVPGAKVITTKHFHRVTNAKTEPEEKDSAKPFIVYCDDMFHYQDTSKRLYMGSFATLDEAREECGMDLMETLITLYEPGITEDALVTKWWMFGDDPWISGPGETKFSAAKEVHGFAQYVVEQKEKEVK